MERLARSFGVVQAPLPTKIPDSVIALCERFVEGDLDESELVEFQILVSNEPWVMTLLQNFEKFNPNWQEAQAQWEDQASERLLERLQAMIPQVDESWDFSILFEPSSQSLDIDFSEPSRDNSVIESSLLEMAHSQDEQAVIIHTRTSKSFQLTISISYSTSNSFHMVIELRPLDARLDTKTCRIRVSSYPSTTVGSKGSGFEAERTPDAQSRVDFDDLVQGGYKIEVFGPDGPIEHFTMNIRRKG